MRKSIVKKALVTTMALSMVFGAGCGSNSDSDKTTAAGSADTTAGSADTTAAGGMSGEITVVSREDGSGTRGAFIELFGVEVKDADGNKTDKTTADAVIANQTNVMMTSVSSDPNAIGYSSLGSLNDTVKALKVEGVDATAENVANGSYTVSRPFNIVTKDGLSEAATDFENFILSSVGQEIVAEGYIKANDKAEEYKSNGAKGKVTVAGSSSVSPIMEKLIEGYASANADVSVELNTSDSSTGIQSTIDGTCDIGMASRELKDTETGITATKIAIDGIAIIVNNDNTLTDISKDNVMKIYTGEITDWSDVK